MSGGDSRASAVEAQARRTEQGTAAGTQACRKRRWVAWADLLRPVFEIDVLACRSCGGRLRLVATIDDPLVIRRILTHLGIPCSLPTPLPVRPPPDMAELPFASDRA